MKVTEVKPDFIPPTKYPKLMTCPSGYIVLFYKPNFCIDISRDTNRTHTNMNESNCTDYNGAVTLENN